MTPHVAFSHAGIYVTDVERMSSFYQRVLGLVVTDDGVLEGTRIVFLSRDIGEHHQLVLASGRGPGTATTINQLSFRVDSLDDLRAMLRRLREENVSALAQTSHATALSVYCHDPEGNRLEFYLDTPWYVEQPMRIPIDLERPDDVVWAEVERVARTLPGFRPAEEWRASFAARLTSPAAV